MSKTKDRSNGQRAAHSPAARARSDDAGRKRSARFAEQGDDGVPTTVTGKDLPGAFSGGGDRGHSPRPPLSEVDSLASTSRSSVSARGDSEVPPRTDEPVEPAGLASTFLQLVDKHWSFAERTDSQAKRALTLLAGVAMLSTIIFCDLAVAAAIFTCSVMVTQSRTGVNPLPITVALLSAPGATGIGLAVRAWFKSRR